jgi:hypothetical protein
MFDFTYWASFNVGYLLTRYFFNENISAGDVEFVFMSALFLMGYKILRERKKKC